jgi:hypothetical protein
MVSRDEIGHTDAIMNDAFFPSSFFTQAEPALLGLAALIGAVIFLCAYNAERRHQK